MTDMLAFFWPWFAVCGLALTTIAVFYVRTKLP